MHVKCLENEKDQSPHQQEIHAWITAPEVPETPR